MHIHVKITGIKMLDSTFKTYHCLIINTKIQMRPVIDITYNIGYFTLYYFALQHPHYHHTLAVLVMHA